MITRHIVACCLAVALTTPAYAVRLLKQATPYNLSIFMCDELDHVSGIGELTLTITASKDGSTFALITPMQTPRSNGWYSIALTSSHTDTVGDLALHITGPGADPTDIVVQIRPNVFGDTLPANVTQFGGTNGAFSSGRPEVNVTHISGDSGAADNARRFFDGSGYGPMILRATVGNIGSQTFFEIVGDPIETEDAYVGCTVVITDNNQRSIRTVIDSGHQEIGNFLILDSAPNFEIDAGTIVEILPPGFVQNDRSAVAAVKTKTDFLPSATAGSAGGLFIAGTNATTTITDGLTANITGSLSGSVGSVTGNVGGNVVGSVGSISGLTITSGRVNADVTHWLGTPPLAPTVPGVPEVDITHVLGSPVCD